MFKKRAKSWLVCQIRSGLWMTSKAGPRKGNWSSYSSRIPLIWNGLFHLSHWNKRSKKASFGGAPLRSRCKKTGSVCACAMSFHLPLFLIATEVCGSGSGQSRKRRHFPDFFTATSKSGSSKSLLSAAKKEGDAQKSRSKIRDGLNRNSL